MTATVNNNTVSMNVQETLPALRRMMDPEELAHYDCMTPTGLDYLGDYRDGVNLQTFCIGQVQSAGGPGKRLAVFNVSTDGAGSQAADLPEGPGEVRSAFSGTRAQTFVSYPNNILSYDRNRPAGSSWYHRPRGSWIISYVQYCQACCSSSCSSV